MYRHVYGISALIGNLYHFLITITLRHAHQTAKLAYAVVDMHYIVAYFKLANLL